MFRILFCAALPRMTFLVGSGRSGRSARGVRSARRRDRCVALSPPAGRWPSSLPGRGRSTGSTPSRCGSEAPPKQALAADGKPRADDRLRLGFRGTADLHHLHGGRRRRPRPADRRDPADRGQCRRDQLKLLSRQSRPDDLYWRSAAASHRLAARDRRLGADGPRICAGRQDRQPYRGQARRLWRRPDRHADAVDQGASSRPKPRASDYISDGRGNIRIMAITDVAGATGYEQRQDQLLLPDQGVARLEAARQLQQPHATRASCPSRSIRTSTSPTASRAVRAAAGRSTASRSTARRRRRWSSPTPQVDVDGTVRIGRARRVVGATYADREARGGLFRPGLWPRSAARCPRRCRACR